MKNLKHMNLKLLSVWEGVFLIVLFALGIYVIIISETRTPSQEPMMIPADGFIITSQGDTAWAHYDTVVYKSYRLK